MSPGLPRTAFVLAGGGSLGAVEVGMLHALTAHGVCPDFVVGASAGAINGAYFASDPTPGRRAGQRLPGQGSVYRIFLARAAAEIERLQALARPQA